MQGCLAGLISRLQAFFERRLADTLLGSSLWTRRYERARLTGPSPSQAVLLVIGMDWGCARCSGSSWLSGVTAPLLARVRDRAQQRGLANVEFAVSDGHPALRGGFRKCAPNGVW